MMTSIKDGLKFNNQLKSVGPNFVTFKIEKPCAKKIPDHRQNIYHFHSDGESKALNLKSEEANILSYLMFIEGSYSNSKDPKEEEKVCPNVLFYMPPSIQQNQDRKFHNMDKQADVLKQEEQKKIHGEESSSKDDGCSIQGEVKIQLLAQHL